jgi:glycosyltransferase involved in cell wall biosynthesis
MRVSIVIPTKNEELYLPLLLASLRGQTYQDFEIIVADAHSTDRTREIATKAGAKVIDGGMPGPGRNRGAAVAQGELIFFFDADVILRHPCFLQDALLEFTARELDVATCGLHVQDGTLLDHAFHEAYNKYTSAIQPVLPHAVGSCILVKKSVHESLQGFDESVVFAEDHDYARRANKMGYHAGILRCHKIAISPRRYRKEGMVRTAAKMVWSEASILVRGPFRSIPFTYEFGKFEEQAQRKSQKFLKRKDRA